MEAVEPKRGIPSLKKLAAVCFCERLNLGFPQPPSLVLEQLSSLADEIKEIILRKPTLKDTPFLSAGMRREEDFHRKKDPVINIPLIQVYEEIDTFNTRKFADQDRICLDPASPYHLYNNFLFHGSLRQDFKWPTIKEGKASVVPLETFKEQLDIFTEGQLKFIDWKNVFAAGGAVLASLLPVPKKYKKDKRAFFHEVGYETSDIDLFLYGLTPTEAKDKVIELYQQILSAVPSRRVGIKKTAHTITFDRGGYPYRPIQVVISKLQRPAEVLSNFDIDCVCVGYDGTSIQCLPRARDAINTRVNVINSALKRIAYLRVMKWQSRGFGFALSEVTTVPFGGTDKVSHTSLAIAKMALLHHHGVFFAGSDNVKNWDKEALFGCQVGKERAIIDALHERDLAFQKTPTQLRVDPDEHWQASCARIGVFYGKSEVDDEEMDENEMDEEMQSVIAQVEKKVDSILANPRSWTWEGAPEFKDWELHGTQSTEIALLQNRPFVTTWTVDTMAEMESKCGGDTDEQGETKRARIEEEEEDEEDEFRKSERNQLFSATTAEDPHGYRWQLTFWTGLSDDDHNCDAEEEGMAVCVELDQTCPALANRIADDDNDNDDDNKGKEWCTVVGVIRFAQNGKTHLILDFTHRFSKKNEKLPLFVHWASVKGEEGSLDQPVEVLLDIRRIHQTLPYL